MAKAKVDNQKKAKARAMAQRNSLKKKKVKPEQLDLPTNEVQAEALVPASRAAKFASKAPTQEAVEAGVSEELKSKKKTDNAVVNQEHTTSKAGLPPASQSYVPTIVFNNKDRTAYYVQRDVRFQIDPFSIAKTIGAAEYGNGRGIIDILPEKVVKQLATVNGWPCEPYDFKELKPLVSGIVEIAWRTCITGDVPTRCTENQEMRVAKYKDGFAALAAKAVVKKEKAASRPKPAGFGPRTATPWCYKPTKEILKATFCGQQLEIFKWFAAHKDGGEVKTIADGMRAAGFKEGKQPAEKVVAFYMNDWLKRKYVSREEATPSEPAKQD